MALVGAPLYWAQGHLVRRRTPRLAEAPGARGGTIAGSSPGLRIVGLGESPMAAVGLAEQREGAVPVLSSMIAETTGRRVDWQTGARSGATARFTRTALLGQVDAGPTDLAVVGLGVNDSLALHSPGRWRDVLADLLAAVRARLEPDRIVITGIPPMQHFPALPFPLSAMLGLRAALLDAVARRLADAEPDLVHAPMDFAERPDGMFCRDGFHPNARAHALWAQQLAAYFDFG